MGKISSLINQKFDSEPVYGGNDKCIKMDNVMRNA